MVVRPWHGKSLMVLFKAAPNDGVMITGMAGKVDGNGGLVVDLSGGPRTMVHHALSTDNAGGHEPGHNMSQSFTM